MGGESFQGFESGDGVEAVLDKDDFRQGDLGESRCPLGTKSGINCNTRLNVSWLGIPGNAIHFSIHFRLVLVTSSISVNVVAPESIATTVQKRICGSSYTRVRATRGTLTANIKRNKT